MCGVPLVLDWTGEALARALAGGAHAVHILTNSRALSPAEAFSQTRSAAFAARVAAPHAHLLLRGDSTLRAHFYEEATALAEVAYPNQTPVIVLAPALPAAGRVTRGGVHFVESARGSEPVGTTEYANDGIFSYRASRLLDWAEERSGGRLKASDGAEVLLSDLRTHGPSVIGRNVAALEARGMPSVLTVDAETDNDVAVAAEGLVNSLTAGTPLVIRCSPAFAAAIEGNRAHRLEPLPVLGRGTLVICGSYMRQSTRQLEELTRDRSDSLVLVDVALLAGDCAQTEIHRAARAAEELLAGGKIAIVATPRKRPPALTDLDSGARIAEGLAAIVASISPRPGVVVSKGGITSAIIARRGLGAELACVVGPIANGVALWRCGEGVLIVVPGNVGGDGLLRGIVQLLEDSR